MTAGNQQQVQSVIDAGLVPLVVQHLSRVRIIVSPCKANTLTTIVTLHKEALDSIE